jgi:hypothetical protein
LETKKPNTEWVDKLNPVVKEINDSHLEKLDKDYKPKVKKFDDKIKFNKNNKVILEVGTKVHRKLEHPENLQGVRLHGSFRKVDIHWSNKVYEVMEYYLFPNSPPLYKIKNSETGKVVKHLLASELLQII